MKQHIITCASDIEDKQGVILARRDVPAGKTYCMHWHDFLEFEIVVSGKAVHVHNNTSSIITDGCAYLMGYYDFHSLTAITDMTLYCIHFHKDLLSVKLADYLDLHNCICQFSKEETETIVGKLQQMDFEKASVLPFGNLVIRNLIEDILIDLVRNSAGSRSLDVPPGIRQAVVFLHSNFRNNITLDRLAKEVSLSTNYLGQLFKRELGVSFNEYLNKLRLRFACALLASTTLTIKEIAFACGYNSVEYFIYTFKRYILVTPTGYRSFPHT